MRTNDHGKANSKAGTVFIEGGPESSNRRNPGGRVRRAGHEIPSAADLGPSGELFNPCSLLIERIDGVNPI